MTLEGALPPVALRRVVDGALEEDLGRGDVTTAAVVEPTLLSDAVIVTREPIVVAGLDVARLVFERVDPGIGFIPQVRDGDSAAAGATIATLAGRATSILGAERVALNFLQRLCGIATLTRAFVEAARGTGLRIADTRKTTPGLRLLERLAVRAGGGANHRFDLSSGVLIKDNHLAVAASIGDAVARARRGSPHGLAIEVEVDSLSQLDEAVAAGADVILLDNFTTQDVREAARRTSMAARRPLLEVSGGVTLGRVRELAEAGADVVSVGSLTHSAPAVDLSLEMTPRARAGQ